MAKIMNLQAQSYKCAELLGKSFQFINFIRDIKEDTEKGRCYLPLSDLTKFGLSELTIKEIEENQDDFKELVRFEIERFYGWYKEALSGYKYIPKEYLVPIKTAADLYEWTAKEIYKNPLRILEGGIKPSTGQIITKGVANMFLIN